MVVLVTVDGSLVFVEGTCDGSTAAVDSAVGVVCFALFIGAGQGFARLEMVVCQKWL